MSYTAGCTVPTLAAGTISNTATVTAPAGVTDPNPANNSAIDSDAVANSIPAISPLALLLLTAMLAAVGMTIEAVQDGAHLGRIVQNIGRIGQRLRRRPRL